MRVAELAIALVLAAVPVQAVAQGLFPSTERRLAPVVESQTQVDAKITNAQRAIPENLTELISENNKNETDLNSATNAYSYLNANVEKSTRKRSETPDITRFKQILSEIKNIECNKITEYNRKLSELSDLHDFIDSKSSKSSPFSFDKNITCSELKRSTSFITPEDIDAWIYSLQYVGEELENKKKLLESYGKLVSLLQARQNQISTSIKNIQQRESLTANFPWFIFLFGSLALGTIFIVSRCFEKEIQMEWIISGQITQFVTVMILMIVITMLGLSRTISGETLGTLLGGVAGYVLAQGVGRAAARDASRALIRAQNERKS